uniref:Uncharacterized protein n=1 Tax=Panagrolaimus sp. JU765 TaxID=591449 RepID=A0AC34QCJ2_9BILA
MNKLFFFGVLLIIFVVSTASIIRPHKQWKLKYPFDWLPISNDEQVFYEDLFNAVDDKFTTTQDFGKKPPTLSKIPIFETFGMKPQKNSAK